MDSPPDLAGVPKRSTSAPDCESDKFPEGFEEGLGWCLCSDLNQGLKYLLSANVAFGLRIHLVGNFL